MRSYLRFIASGDTILGASRGFGDCVEEIVETLEHMNINMLFTIGCDGTQKGALDISEEVKELSQNNLAFLHPIFRPDLSLVQKSFGFQTAVFRAVDAVACAHVEAHDGVNDLVSQKGTKVAQVVILILYLCD